MSSNTQRISLLPHEIPELIQNLFKSTDNEKQRNKMPPFNYLRKRSDENLDDREVSVANDSDKRRRRDSEAAKEKKPVVSVEKREYLNHDEDKISDSEFNESFKSLQRRHLTGFGSDDNENQERALKDDDDFIVQNLDEENSNDNE